MKTQQEIIDLNPSLCYTCKWARKPASDENRDNGYVGCAYFAQCDDRSDYKLFSTIGMAKELAEGWVDLRASVFGEKSGRITNLQILTKEVTACKQYDHEQTHSH